MHAVGHPGHRPGGRGGGVGRAVQPVGVLGRRGGRTRGAHRRAGGQHDGGRGRQYTGGHAGKIGKQQPRDDGGRAAGQETLSDGLLARRPVMRRTGGLQRCGGRYVLFFILHIYTYIRTFISFFCVQKSEQNSRPPLTSRVKYSRTPCLEKKTKTFF